jgi:hypothetical protein
MTNINNNDKIGEGYEDADIQYGYRRSQWRTRYEYRGYSSLTPAQIMELETYYRYAKVKVAVQRVTYILQLILLHQASYVSLRTLITRWSGIASVVRVVAIAREKVEKSWPQ